MFNTECQPLPVADIEARDRGEAETPQLSFSEQVRAETWPRHEAAATAGLLHALVAGTLPRERYVDLVAQYWLVYGALEDVAATAALDPMVVPFVTDGLRRLGPLEADLAHLAGPEWQRSVRVTAAAARYCERIRTVAATWSGAFVAHHYIRYLGDLSGGQIIGRAAMRTYDLTPTAGAAFYDFSALGDADAFKARYRRLLDCTPWDDAQRRAIIDEMLVAYDMNTELLAELDASGT